MRIEGVKSRRGQRNWRPGPGETYIGRPGPFGNPYKVSPKSPLPQVLRQYEIYLRERLQRDPAFRAQFEALSGQTLVCWCVPSPVGPSGPVGRAEVCHGEVMQRVAGEQTP